MSDSSKLPLREQIADVIADHKARCSDPYSCVDEPMNITGEGWKGCCGHMADRILALLAKQYEEDGSDPSAVFCADCGHWFAANCPDCKPTVQSFDTQMIIVDRDRATEQVSGTGARIECGNKCGAYAWVNGFMNRWYCSESCEHHANHNKQASDEEPRYTYEQAFRKIVGDVVFEALRHETVTRSEEAFAIRDHLIRDLPEKIKEFQDAVNADLVRRDEGRDRG